MSRATKDYYLPFARYNLFCYACVSLAPNWPDFYPLLGYVDPLGNGFAFDRAVSGLCCLPRGCLIDFPFCDGPALPLLGFLPWNLPGLGCFFITNFD
jgi:hypothetical protein